MLTNREDGRTTISGSETHIESDVDILGHGRDKSVANALGASGNSGLASLVVNSGGALNLKK